VATLEVGTVPAGVLFDKTNIWVTNNFSVTKLRSDGTILGTFPAGGGAGALAFDGTCIWVASYGSGYVTKLDAQDGKLLGAYGLLAAPRVGGPSQSPE
jgi:DNA-binding beta-propeller fold protein YncE